MPEANLTAQRYLVFVSLGDSLTAGFQNPSPSNPAGLSHPYTRDLQFYAWQEVNRLGLSWVVPVIENEGRVGESTKGMLRRFDAYIPPYKPDYVVIWVRLNDLSSGVGADAAASNLREMYVKTRAIKAEPIACGLSPVAGSAKFNEKLREYNSKIMELCASVGVQYVDLFTSLADGDGRLLGEFNNDGAHLSTEGYIAVASIIFSEAVKPIIGKLGAN